MEGTEMINVEEMNKLVASHLVAEGELEAAQDAGNDTTDLLLKAEAAASLLSNFLLSRCQELLEMASVQIRQTPEPGQ
jgi:hypothetical protein